MANNKFVGALDLNPILERGKTMAKRFGIQ